MKVENPDNQAIIRVYSYPDPVLFNLSPSGTAFAVGAATYFNDVRVRNNFLRTAEIAGHSVMWNNTRHYLLAEIALVGECIMLAMRTTTP